MKKRLISLLLVLVMTVTLVPAVFAANGTLSSKLNELQDHVNVPAKMQVQKDGTTTWATTLTLKQDEMTQPFNYVTTLTTSPIKNAITEDAMPRYKIAHK